MINYSRWKAQDWSFRTADVQPSATHHDITRGVRGKFPVVDEAQLADLYKTKEGQSLGNNKEVARLGELCLRDSRVKR